MTKKKFFSDENASSNSDGHLSLEMIAFQSDDYPRQLEAVIEEILKDGTFRFRRKDDPRMKKIEDLTFQRTGIRIRMVTNSLLAATLPFYPNQHSAIINSPMRGKLYEPDGWKLFMKEQLKVLDKSLVQTGTVDLKECRVTGMFSLCVCPLYMNWRELAGYKLTAREMTGIFLHELGHLFTAYEYSNRLNRTNVVLADLAGKVIEQKNPDKEYVFRELRKLNKKTTDEELEALFRGDNVILGRAVMKFLSDTASEALPVGWYSETSSETLADNFAARWGYGVEVVTGLEKLGLGGFWRAENSFFGAFFSTIWTIVSSLYLLGMILIMVNKAYWAISAATLMGILSGGFTLVVALLVGITLYGILAGSSSYFHDMTYDDTKHRYNRIRNQLVQLIKEVDELPADQLHQTVAQIKQLDDLVESRGNYRNFLGAVIDFVSPRSREINADIKIQRLLESLSANGLFVQAALLRQTA